MTIPSVVQGTVEFAGKVFEVDSPRGQMWLESVGSFRFVPVGNSKPYTVRKESGKGGDYWYGYRKVAGRLHKKYVGKTSELSTAKLEEIAEALNTPSQPRVTDKVTEVTEGIEQAVTERVTDSRADVRLTALELQVQALQESLEALRSELPGKSESGNSEELPTVTDNELQTELGNLQAENEKLKADYAALLESSSAVTNKLRQELAEVRSQLATERTDREEIEVQIADLKQNPAPATDLPEAGDLLSRVRRIEPKNKKEKVAQEIIDLPIVKLIQRAILELVEGEQ